MIPMYYSFIRPSPAVGVIDGNWVMRLVHDREYRLFGLLLLEVLL